MSIVLTTKNLCKNFVQADGSKFRVLKNIDLTIKAGEVVGFIGPSGSGKSTLLHLIGLLLKPTSGEITINNTETSTLSADQLTKLRLNDIGFIYQFHHLIPELNVLENIILPLQIKGITNKICKEKSIILLKNLKLENCTTKPVAKLSGGQQQRVAIARALISRPSLILADEPTGNLDSENANIVMNILIDVANQHNTSVLIVTHNQQFTKYMDTKYLVDNHTIMLQN